MKVKPVNPDAIIRDPHTKQPLPAEGGEVPDDNFWNRRLRDGSVVRVEEESAKNERTAPVGNEPIAALTTRGGK